jgi:ferredoxin
MSESRWRVAVDHTKCIGSGICAGVAAGHFRLDQGKSWPVSELVEPDDGVLDAADICPTEAITVRDQAGNPVPSPS